MTTKTVYHIHRGTKSKRIYKTVYEPFFRYCAIWKSNRWQRLKAVYSRTTVLTPDNAAELLAGFRNIPTDITVYLM